jgi:hypothetical protein
MKISPYFKLVAIIGSMLMMHLNTLAQDSLVDQKGWIYKGGIKKGKKDGYGTLFMKTNSGKDSLVTGYWKHDQFMGMYEYPFKMLGKTFMVSNVQISYEPGTPPNNTIEISMESVSGGAFNVHGEIPKPSLTEAIFQRGSYQLMMPVTNQQKRNTYIFQNVIYPATVLFKIGTEEVQIEFNAEKNYKVFINTRD